MSSSCNNAACMLWGGAFICRLVSSSKQGGQGLLYLMRARTPALQQGASLLQQGASSDGSCMYVDIYRQIM